VDPTFPDDSFSDFPSMGVDKFALYIGCNAFEFNEQAPPDPTLQGSGRLRGEQVGLLAGVLTVTPTRRHG
jgi:hypothetical protein